jgi:hypothetical protein
MTYSTAEAEWTNVRNGFLHSCRAKFCSPTDDSIQRDDIDGKKLTGSPYEITVDESDRVGSASTHGLLGRRRNIGR